MPFSRPTLGELIERVTTDFETRLGAATRLRRSVERVLARVVAGAAHTVHGHIAWIARQIIWDTAEGRYLERWAAIFGVERKPAVRAKAGSATITGNVGAVMPQGTRWQRADGVVLLTDVEVVIGGGGSVAVTFTAELGGAAGNTDVGVRLSLVNPVPDIDSTCTLTAAMTGGVEAEGDEPLRARFLARVREPPAAGTQADYVRWALEVPGVSRAWALPLHLGVGTVGVPFMVDDDPAGPFPSPDQVMAVQAHVDERRPVTAQVTCFAPAADPIAFELAVVPDDAATRTAVEVELADLFLRRASPGGVVLLSDIRAAIKAVTDDYNLVTPSNDVTASSPGALPVPGDFTWV